MNVNLSLSKDISQPSDLILNVVRGSPALESSPTAMMNTEWDNLESQAKIRRMY